MKPVVAWKLDENDITSGGSYVVGDVVQIESTAGAVLTVINAPDKNTKYTCLVTLTEGGITSNQESFVFLNVYGNFFI